MKIGIISGMWQPIPPYAYGGGERIVFNLAVELYRMGEDITLFAPRGSSFPGKLIEISDRVFINSPGGLISHLRCWLDILRAEKCDIYHNHGRLWNVPFIISILRRPCVHSFYSPIDPRKIKICQSLSSADRLRFTATSHSHIKSLQSDPSSPYWSTVYIGLDISQIPFYAMPKHKPYLASVGRVCPEKGTDLAIAIAHKSGIPLIIAGPVQPHNAEYFAEKVKPSIDGDFIKYIGEINEVEQYEIFGNAVATLFPITWSEPFGLVLLYSLACGTPVIAFDKGAVSEVIRNGINGFMVRTIEEASDRLKDISSVDRAGCRKTVEGRFTSRIMAENYLKIYLKLV